MPENDNELLELILKINRLGYEVSFYKPNYNDNRVKLTKKGLQPQDLHVMEQSFPDDHLVERRYIDCIKYMHSEIRKKIV